MIKRYDAVPIEFDSIYEHINLAITPYVNNFLEYKEFYKFQTLLLLGLAKTKQPKCLDLGCGHGFLGMILSRLGWKYYGIDDLGDAPINYSEDEFQRIFIVDSELHQWSGFNFIQGDIFQKTEFPEGMFDIGVFKDVIEHLHKSPRPILEEFYRVLKPGGALVCIAPNSVNILNRLRVLWGKSNYPKIETFYQTVGDWRGHVREPTLQELKQMLTWAGFQIHQSFTFDVDCEVDKYLTGKSFFKKIYRALCHFFPTLRQQLICIARKLPKES